MTEYIPKSAVVAEIEKRLKANGAFDEVGDEAWAEDKGMCEAYRSILSFINTLEVKEVDLDEEFDKCCENYIFDDECEVYTAKHFFELGLKARG